MKPGTTFRVTETDEPPQKLQRHVESMIEAVESCIASGRVLPALVLLYSTIDCLAWLARPATTNEPQNEDVTRSDFKQWCSDYMDPTVTLGCSGADLYAARCALLHTQISQSKLSREADARELTYQVGCREVLLSIGLNAPLEPVLVDIQELVGAFRAGATRFLADCKGPALRPLVEARSPMFLVRGEVTS